MSDKHYSQRLLMRQWKDNDRKIFAAINDDPDVMHYFPRRFTRKESDTFIDSNINHINDKGWGVWAVEVLESGEFIGFVGFSNPAKWHPCAGHIDIGWRLRHDHWGHGYATEAAKYAMKIGFGSLGFESVVAFTSECNWPSIKVMKKIGMHDDAVGFEHPRIDVANRLRNHVVYRLNSTEWQNKDRMINL